MIQCDLLFIFRHSPYGSSLGREGLEAALAAGAFEQNMAILFLDEGVWQLLDNQAAEHIARKNHQKMAKALPLFGIDKLYCSADHLHQRALEAEALAMTCQPLDNSQIKQLMANAKNILSF
ncbi:MAG TPA: sulfurtransferase complex subunit TusC [Marinagarivorans sp.]